jgi:hypothetical protein
MKRHRVAWAFATPLKNMADWEALRLEGLEKGKPSIQVPDKIFSNGFESVSDELESVNDDLEDLTNPLLPLLRTKEKGGT